MNTQDLTHCTEVCKKYSKTYITATKFLPKHVQEAIIVLYAFFRLPDEIVDNPDPGSNPKERLTAWIDAWHQTKDSPFIAQAHPVLRATREVFVQFAIPDEYADAFFKAMMADTEEQIYITYDELKEYMYGSAVVVGYMVCHVIGFKDGALPYAADLGYAMQLTNFLRDIKEDYHDRGRIYFPKEELDQFSITEQYFSDHIVDEKWKAFMKFQCDRAQKLYDHSYAGIELLETRARFAVYLAHGLYQHILKKIERVEFDVFTHNTNLTLTDKFTMIAKVVWNKNQ